MTGTVAWWNPDRGWGFIVVGELDVFVHHAALDDPRGDLRPGQAVKLDVGIGTQGPVALNVRSVRARS